MHCVRSGYALTSAAHVQPNDLTLITPGTNHRGRSLGLAGCSQAHRKLLGQLAKIAKINAEVLLAGPTGVGKELYARFLHQCSDREENSFVAVNCGAIPDSLFENELFGHLAGAYTGAQAPGKGLISEAEGGTLFLDEVDSLSTANQVKLLRLLQEKEYRRLGETRIRKANIRVVSATNADLESCVRRNRFREDLLYRIRVVPIHVVPLQKRRDDIAELLNVFIHRYAAQYGVAPIKLTPAAWNRLIHYHWPGNVRELQNCVRSLTCQQFDTPIDSEDLSLETPTNSVPDPTPESTQSFRCAKDEVVRNFEIQYIHKVLNRSNGNIGEAAKLAGKHRRAFFELMRKHSIRADAFKISVPADLPTSFEDHPGSPPMKGDEQNRSSETSGGDHHQDDIDRTLGNDESL